jgi:hypothetical protein
LPWYRSASSACRHGQPRMAHWSSTHCFLLITPYPGSWAYLLRSLIRLFSFSTLSSHLSPSPPSPLISLLLLPLLSSLSFSTLSSHLSPSPPSPLISLLLLPLLSSLCHEWPEPAGPDREQLPHLLRSTRHTLLVPSPFIYLPDREQLPHGDRHARAQVAPGALIT